MTGFRAGVLPEWARAGSTLMPTGVTSLSCRESGAAGLGLTASICNVLPIQRLLHIYADAAL